MTARALYDKVTAMHFNTNVKLDLTPGIMIKVKRVPIRFDRN